MRRINIFNKVPFDKITKRELIKKIAVSAKKGEKKLILNMNAYGVTTYLKNKRYAEVINTADIIYSDGWGPVFVSRFQEEKLKTRVNVGDYINEILDCIQKNGLSIYLLGGHSDQLEKTVNVIKKMYPMIKLSGHQHGYFTKNAELKIVKDIKRKHPNIVFVGMGVPKQEFWISDNWKSLPSAVYMGVGAVFEYIAGKKRAPIWMRENGLEWLYRLFQEPKRLSKRYTIDNIYFIYAFLKNILGVSNNQPNR
jgi:N-acetylglucosaminyldiphosphoundecaprenol N-acetyl-beta-D-mannosaminyltransferase